MITSASDSLQALADHDWSHSALGAPDSWPHALRLTVDIMLNDPLPMLLMWGHQQVMLYNNAYIEVAGAHANRAPGAIVPPIPPAAWSWNPAAIEQAWHGQAQHYPCQTLHLWREGTAIDARFDLFYTPLRDEAGQVCGILCSLAPPSAAMPSATTDDQREHLRILVVEDNVDAQFLVCEMLRAFGHEVQATTRGEDALQLLQSRSFDILFSDVSLPGMSGVELGRQALRAQPGLHIVFASGYSEALTAKLDYPSVAMQKPYDIEQLQAVLERLSHPPGPA